MVLGESDERFLFRTPGGVPEPFPLDLVAAARADPSAGLKDLVEQQMPLVHGLPVTYFGTISAAEGAELVVAAFTAATATPAGIVGSAAWFTIDQLRGGGHGAALLEVLADARRWVNVARGADEISRRIQPAVAAALNYLDTNMSGEGDLLGWDLYQSGTAIGTLSTALGLMAHIHADQRGRLVERPAETLRQMQNPDGGWRVRRSLIGASSDVSITESTALCLQSLRAAGDDSSASVQQAVAWLEGSQRPDGGWSTIALSGTGPDHGSRVFPSAVALRALAGLGSREKVAHGVAWLRRMQNEEGGWGMTSTSKNDLVQAAYTSHAVIALLACEVRPDDPAVRRGCDLLLALFDQDADEPWASSITPVTIVDGATSASLEFRHFGTPWALVALTLAGHGVDEFPVLVGLRRLLRLQQNNGTWRCQVISPASPPIWTTHDALLALRTVLTAATRRIPEIALDQPRRYERATLERVILSAQSARTAVPGTRTSRPGRFLLLWMSFLTVAVVVLGLSAFGLVDQVRSGSTAARWLAAVLGAGAAVLAAVAPAILTEEYKIRRRPRGGGEEDNE